jgi:hypothetical protein
MDMETTTATLGFVLDAFASRHLRDWFWLGMCPNDWDYEDLEAFEAWVAENADDLYDDMGWTALVRLYEATR